MIHQGCEPFAGDTFTLHASYDGSLGLSLSQIPRDCSESPARMLRLRLASASGLNLVLLFWCLRHPGLLHSLDGDAWCLPWIIFVLQPASELGASLFSHLFLSNLQSPKAQFLGQIGLELAGGFKLATRDTDRQIHPCGDFLQETKLKIITIHKNTTENTGFLVDGTGNVQFCVLLSCPHISSSWTDDFLCKL